MTVRGYRADKMAYDSLFLLLLKRVIVELLKWGFSCALPKPTSFSCLDTRKRSKRKSRLMFRADPLCAYSLNVENSPSAQTVRRFSSLTFAQAGSRLGA